MAQLWLLWLGVTALPLLAQLSPPQRAEVFDSAVEAVSERFHDPQFRGVNWAALAKSYRAEFQRARSDQEAEQLIRDLLARLRNSHLGFHSPEDLRLRRGVLPFLFERAGNRVFVIEARTEALQPGDEILRVDERPAPALEPPLPRYLRPLRDNPYFGEAGSEASVEALSGQQPVRVRAARVSRGGEAEGWRLERPAEGIGHLRLRRIPRGDELRKLLVECQSSRALILDLRHCSGGVLESSLPLVSFFLGPGLDFYLHRPRTWRETRVYDANPPDTTDVEVMIRQGIAVQFRTCDYGLRFQGPLAVLVNDYTASEAELIVAALQDHRRARVFGQRTNGAVSGWSQAADLPHGFGMLAVPYTSARTPLGRDLEGVGVEPDELVANSSSDLRSRRDRVLSRALESLRSAASPR